jgi:hypothetical protein
MTMISVNADALYQVLQALVGLPHEIRELQATRTLDALGTGPRNPINILVDQYSEFAEKHNASSPE